MLHPDRSSYCWTPPSSLFLLFPLAFGFAGLVTTSCTRIRTHTHQAAHQFSQPNCHVKALYTLKKKRASPNFMVYPNFLHACPLLLYTMQYASAKGFYNYMHAALPRPPLILHENAHGHQSTPRLQRDLTRESTRLGRWGVMGALRFIGPGPTLAGDGGGERKAFDETEGVRLAPGLAASA